MENNNHRQACEMFMKFFFFLVHSFEDSDISPYKKPSVADDEDPDQALQWRRATATGKLKPDIDLDKFKVGVKTNRCFL